MKIQEIGAFEAKTKFSALLEKTERGQSFRITKRGKVVARLIPESSQTISKSELNALSLVELSQKIRKQWKGKKGDAQKIVRENRRQLEDRMEKY